MTYSEIQEKLILSDKNTKNHSFLELEFPYKASYELMNIEIINASKKGETNISFDFADTDLREIANMTLAEIDKGIRNIYPSYDSGTRVVHGTFNYPRYLAARGFDIVIKEALKHPGYVSKSYYISWNK